MSWRHKIFSTALANKLTAFGVFEREEVLNIDIEKFAKIKGVGEKMISELEKFIKSTENDCIREKIIE